MPARAQGATAFPTPEEAVTALANAAKAAELDAVLALFGPEGRELVSSSDRGDRAPEPRRVRGGDGRRMEARGPRPGPQGAGRRQRGVAVPRAARQDVPTDGGSIPPPARKKCCSGASGGTSSPPSASPGPTSTAQRALRAQEPRRQARGHLRAAHRQRTRARRTGCTGRRGRGEPHSPLGPLVAEAAAEGRSLNAAGQRAPSPFHGYYFRVLEAQGPPRQAARRAMSPTAR